MLDSELCLARKIGMLVITVGEERGLIEDGFADR